MPVMIWSSNRVSEALPKTYHQPIGPAAPFGIGWVNIGRMLARTFRRASSQPPTARSQRFIVAPFPQVRLCVGQAFQPDVRKRKSQAGKPDLPLLAERVLQGRGVWRLDEKLP